MEHLKVFWKRRGLLWELVKKGVKLKYRRSYLGILWSFLEPLLTTIVLTVVFGTLLGRGDEKFTRYVLCGELLCMYVGRYILLCTHMWRPAVDLGYLLLFLSTLVG